MYRARLPATAAAAAGVELLDSSIFLQDVGRFLFAYPISSGDVVWTVGVEGECGPDCERCVALWHRHRRHHACRGRVLKSMRSEIHTSCGPSLKHSLYMLSLS